MDVVECVGGAGRDVLGSVQLHAGVFDSNIKLIILESPAPILIRHAVDTLKVFVLEQ